MKIVQGMGESDKNFQKRLESLESTLSSGETHRDDTGSVTQKRYGEVDLLLERNSYGEIFGYLTSLNGKVDNRTEVRIGRTNEWGLINGKTDPIEAAEKHFKLKHKEEIQA